MIFCKEIQERKSNRLFSKRNDIDRQVIINIITAATLAPSAKNSQPWRFFVVEEPSEEFIGFFPHNKWVKTAAFFIVVYMEPSATIKREKELMAIGAAIENMLLEAQAEGIASCWIGECFERQEEIDQWTGVHNAELMAVIGFGNKRTDSARAERRALSDVVYNWVQP
ncbi:MAG: nitroreductase family protein [Acetatifactor sp.]